jgi:sensor domain CHASE-containing protein
VNTLQYRILMLLGVLALVLAVLNALMFSSNREAQNELSARAQYIQQSLQLEPLYQSLVKSLADLAARDGDTQLGDLLAAQGISFSAAPAATPGR